MLVSSPCAPYSDRVPLGGSTHADRERGGARLTGTSDRCLWPRRVSPPATTFISRSGSTEARRIRSATFLDCGPVAALLAVEDVDLLHARTIVAGEGGSELVRSVLVGVPPSRLPDVPVATSFKINARDRSPRRRSLAPLDLHGPAVLWPRTPADRHVGAVPVRDCLVTTSAIGTGVVGNADRQVDDSVCFCRSRNAQRKRSDESDREHPSCRHRPAAVSRAVTAGPTTIGAITNAGWLHISSDPMMRVATLQGIAAAECELRHCFGYPSKRRST
jgi:hypothetical protein